MMSGFEDNPFADPFQGATSNRPQARLSGDLGTTVKSSALDTFNPFATDSRTAGGGVEPTPPRPGGFVPPYVPAAAPPPAYTPNAAQMVTTDELERRQRDLEARAAELARREDEQRRREEDAVRSGDFGPGRAGSQTNNWPPLPSFIPCSPCFYQDIDVEIPLEFRRMVRFGYYLWIAYSVILCLNILGTLAYFIEANDGTAGSVFGVSILIMLIFVPISFVCWFRPLYKAFRSDSSFNFFIFFFVFFAQCVILVIQCLGVNWFGSCGWINALMMFGRGSSGAGVVMVTLAALFTVLAVVSVLLLIRVHRLYRSTGASFEKARQEFSHGVATNQVVRGTATDFGSAAARGAFTGVGGPTNRY